MCLQRKQKEEMDHSQKEVHRLKVEMYALYVDI